jgi:arylformamidase
MQVILESPDGPKRADLSQPHDISIPLRSGADNPNAFWAPMPDMSPVVAGDFVGSTNAGGVVNFFNVRFNPHGNGTHTECVGHIATERYVLPDCLQRTHWLARVLSVYPMLRDDGDRVIELQHLLPFLQAGEADALVLRTLPNHPDKQIRTWSGTNPTYLHHEAMDYIVACGIRHLLVDLPSVDREEDGGQLLAHKSFWQYPGPQVRTDCTITEMVFVPDQITDGDYLLDLQTAHFDLDASPSRPILYRIY